MDTIVLVYGDQHETLSVAEATARIKRGVAGLAAQARGLQRHQALVEAFIDFAALVQGLADWEFEQRGCDELSPLQDRLTEGLRGFAEAIDRSWRSGFSDEVPPGLGSLAGEMPSSVTLKRCEGYAYYSLYPEAYLEAARSLPPGCTVIGLRSIGTGLAALVAAASDARTILTLRPTGHPFSRSVRAGPQLEALVRANRGSHFAIVDEGPGLSGSSFGGVADWLEGFGVPGERIVFMPSHEGELGPRASEEHRARWDAADRRLCSFEALFTAPDARAPLHRWFHDITGDLTEPPRDLSGGAWAQGRGLPTSPSREARKYLLRGRHGDFLVKFTGLDRAARAKFARARALHAAGFCPEPLALRYGFIIERFIDGAPVEDVATSLLTDYLAFRRDSFPGPPGASLSELLAMAAHNIREADPGTAFDLAGRWSEERLGELQAAVAPVHVDARLHRWEWLRSGGRIVKTDAVDHSQAHDLVGCQDILWDVAGAIVELDAARDGERAFAEPFTGADPARRELLQMMKLCYLGFQIGWWSMSGTAEGLERSAWYRRQVAPMMAALG